MRDLKVCRICLRKGVKVYHLDSFNLKQYYEEIMAKEVNEKDGLPKYFCYECAAFLYKFHKFKEKCLTGENTLKELLWVKCGSITLSSISKIDRKDKNLQSPIGILTVSKRVRTHIIKHKTVTNQLEEIKEAETPEKAETSEIAKTEKAETPEIPKTPETAECKMDYECDNSLDDKNRAKIKLEMDNEKDPFKEIEKPEINTKAGTQEEAVAGVEDDRMFSDDEDFRPESTDDVDKPDIEEKIKDTITIEVTPLIPVPANSAGESLRSLLNKNHKGKKRKTEKNKDLVNEKHRKFEVREAKNKDLDPKHWLKTTLTEEEAMEEFRAKALDRKYVSAAYRCSDCYKGFSKEDMLIRHKLKHSESAGPVVCRFCKMRFKRNHFLTSHLPQHYTKYKCLRCDLVCPLETTALFHNDYHNGVIRKCKHCGGEFRHESTYYTHLRTHRSEHVCTLCGMSFVSALGLRMHKTKKHVNTDSELPQDEEQYCQRCDIKFETRKAYEEHLKHSTRHVDGLEDLEKSEPITSNAKKPVKRVVLKRKIPTDCHVCGKHFETQAACRKHILAEHPGTSLIAPNEKKICEICGMLLAPLSMPSHLNTHTKEKLHPCKTCGREFNSTAGLYTHQLTHSSVKPVACTLCDKRFKQSSSMQLHYRTYHLKEPYPKRNRKKKTDDDSDDNLTLDKFFGQKS